MIEIVDFHKEIAENQSNRPYRSTGENVKEALENPTKRNCE